MTIDTKDDLGQEIPGEVWHTAMRYTGLAAARRIVWLTKVWRRCKQRMRDAERVAANRATHVAACHDMTARAQNVAIAAIAEKSELSDQLNAARKEADELRTQRDRAEALCQEQATLIKQLEERLRQATQPVDRSKLPTVPPQVGYRYERRNGTGCEIVGDYGSGVAYRFAANDGRTYTSNGDYGTFRERHALDLVREIGPVKP